MVVYIYTSLTKLCSPLDYDLFFGAAPSLEPKVGHTLALEPTLSTFPLWSYQQCTALFGT